MKARAASVIGAAGLAAWLAAGAAFLVRGRGHLPGPEQDQSPQVAVDYAERGEALIHGLPVDPDLHMNLPVSTVWAALAFDHWGASLRCYKTAVLAAFLVLLGAVCAALCPGSPWPAAMAAALAAWCLSPDFLVYPQLEYAVLVGLAAGALVWRSRQPSWRRTLVFSLAVGATLLFRSPLAFFPPLLALDEWIRIRRSRAAPYWRRGLILCVVPYLFLIPWTRMNWLLRHQVVVFEGGQASTNIVTGALGLVQTIEGDWTMLVDPSVDASRPSAVLAWAAREVGKHPLRYVEAVVRRAHLCLSQFPVLWFLAFAAWWRFRRRPGHRQLGLLAAYFVLIHCAMSVDLRYLTPLWPLLAVLAASLAELPASPKADGEPWPARAGAAAILAGVLLTLGLTGYTMAKVWAMAGAAGLPWSDEAWLKKLGSSPRDAWLLAQRAGQRLEAGDAATAAENLARAVGLRPDRVDYSLKLEWVRNLSGRGGRILEWRLPSTVVDFRVKMAFRLYRAHALMRKGDRKAALEEIRKAKAIFEATIRVHGAPAERERLLAEMLVSRDERFPGVAMGFMVGLPAREALSFCRELAKVEASADRQCLGLIEAAAASDPGFAAQAAKQADPSGLPPTGQHRLALLRQRVGDYRGAVRILKELVKRHPGEGVYFSDLGVNEFLAGSADQAVADLKVAIRLSPDRLAPYASLAAVYARQGRNVEALRVYDAALSVRGQVRDPSVRDDIVKARKLILEQQER
ncbi:MAG: hypothetical protein HY748_01135 [Elusimicrobia bacterium]|nr:hypothetical protein [Elusimicrobiota bacterium]